MYVTLVTVVTLEKTFSIDIFCIDSMINPTGYDTRCCIHVIEKTLRYERRHVKKSRLNNREREASRARVLSI